MRKTTASRTRFRWHPKVIIRGKRSKSSSRESLHQPWILGMSKTNTLTTNWSRCSQTGCSNSRRRTKCRPSFNRSRRITTRLLNIYSKMIPRGSRRSRRIPRGLPATREPSCIRMASDSLPKHIRNSKNFNRNARPSSI